MAPAVTAVVRGLSGGVKKDAMHSSDRRHGWLAVFINQLQINQTHASHYYDQT